MPRIRTIKPEHWSDKDLANISVGAHLTWISMWNFSDDKGIIENDPHLIKSNSFPRRKEIKISHIQKWISELVKYRFVIPFEYNNTQYLIHRTWDIHQKVEKSYPSKIPSDIIREIVGERSGNDTQTLSDDSTTIPHKERRGEERRVKERKGEEENGYSGDNLIFDIEKYLFEHRKDFETICMNAHRSEEEVLPVLKKYHLHNQEKDYYPKKPIQLIAGLQKWLMNEKEFNGSHQQFSSNGSAKLGTSAARIERAKKF